MKKLTSEADDGVDSPVALQLGNWRSDLDDRKDVSRQVWEGNLEMALLRREAMYHDSQIPLIT